ncbi:MAG: hypothetical protein WC575_01850 [Patescibacteria group bacterium]
MFDNITNKPKPSSVEDIFADTEVTPTNIPPSPTAGTSFVPLPIPPAPRASGLGSLSTPTHPLFDGGKKWLMIIGAIVVVIIIGMGAYWWWTNTKTSAPVNTEPELTNQPIEPEQPPITVPPVEMPTTNPELEDTDNDRLNTREEFELGTDPQNFDTDADGLFDGEEVKVWHTDPLNPDTDGDGYLDGEEVINNYNPNGPGRLLELPSGEINFQELDNILDQINQEG